MKRVPPAFRPLLWIGLSLALSLPARGAHFLGGDIAYECLGANQYLITLNLFRECSGAAMIPQDLTFQSSCGQTFTLTALPVPPPTEVSQLCGAQLANSSCNGGPLPGVEHYAFQATVTLAPCNFWTISWSICCRAGMVNVTGFPGLYIQATLNNALVACDNSPVFLDQSIPYVCLNQPVSYNFGVNEPDGNPITYSLISARYAAPGPIPVTYAGGYSGASPIAGGTLNTTTGQYTFTATTAGYYVVVVQVTQYDAFGNIIGTVMRDQMFIVIPCTSNTPAVGVLQNNTAGLLTGPNSIQICNGQPFCVEVMFTDVDAGTIIDVMTNALTLLPGATFTVTGTNPAVAQLCWTGNSANSPVNVLIQADDNACPVENIVSTSVNITTVSGGVAPSPGTSAVWNVCANAPPGSLFAQLGGAPQAGGIWTAPGGGVVTGTFNPATSPPGVYTYTVGNACANASATVTVNLLPAPNAGTNGTTTLCSNSVPINLFTFLGGAPQVGGSWTGPGGGAHSNIYDPVIDGPGVYTYTVVGAGVCGNSSASVSVVELPGPNAGTNGVVTICAGAPITPLFGYLGGSPQAGGQWTNTFGGNWGGNFNPAVHPAGVYTYTVPGTAPCPNASATVTVTLVPAANAGTNGTLNICETAPAVALIASLGGTPQAGGAWSGPSPVIGGLYDPATMNPGVYTYTVSGGVGCASASATVTVNETLSGGSAGTNGNLNICSTAAAASLFAQLGGTPQAGGAWSGPSTVVGGMYDPVTMAPGVYTYTIAGSGGCPGASATVTVVETAPTNAGTNGTLNICATSAAASLFAQLGGTPQAGGAWNGPSAVVGGLYDPATMNPGVYTYTVTGTGGCANASATVTVTETAAPNAGTNGTLDVCSNGTATNLFTLLGGTPQAGGAWSGPSAVVGGLYDPITMNPGVYTYMVTGTGGCANASATVTVTETAAPNAGTSGTLDICSTAGAASLFAQLGGTPQAGGAWSGPSAVVGGLYDPTTMNPGVYTYTATGTGGCANASATVTVTETAAPNAGTNGTLDVCSNGTATNLFTLLGGTPQAGGAWSGPSAVVGGLYDPATMNPGVYTYTVTGTGGCANATATISVTEIPAPNAGTNGALAICSNSPSTNLFVQLGGAPQGGGTWSGPSVVVGGLYNPATMNPGVYTYTVTGSVPCTDASATVTVNESTPGNAGLDANVVVCSSGVPFALFGLLGGSPDPGGTWTDPGGAAHIDPFDPAIGSSGVYTYLIAANGACPADQSTVTVTVNTAADAGVDANLVVCEQDAPFALITALNGTPDAGGTWSGPSSVVGGVYDAATMNPGVYTYAVNGLAPCVNASATVTIAEVAAADAGSNGALAVCTTGGAADLFMQLGGAPQPGGTWSGPSTVVSGQYDPVTMNAGLYTYFVAGTGGCPGASATVFVTETMPGNAGVDASIALCSNGASVVLFSLLGGSPTIGGGWTAPGGLPHSGTFNPASGTPGIYTYTVAAIGPCPSDQSTVTVTVNYLPNAGTNGSLTICEQAASVNLFNSLGGSPQANGSWSGPSAVVGGLYDPGGMLPGVYTYSLAGNAPCPNVSTTVTVIETPAPDAGVNGALTICEIGAPAGLFAQLGGTPQAGGAWSGPSVVIGGVYNPLTMNPGVYTYTVPGVNGCADATASITVTEQAAANAGTNGSLSICTSSAPVALFAQLGGTPQVGGGWNGPSIVMGGLYDPATMNPGVYTYTVSGIGTCPDASATVTVTETAAPNAGTNGSITLCSNAAPISLFSLLGGSPDPGGIWIAPGGLANSGTFNPTTGAPGVYTYTVAPVGPCPGAQSTVTVTVVIAPNPGLNANLNVCDIDPPTSLFLALNGTPQVAGTWSGPSAVVGGQYDPLTMTPGVYTYTVNGTAPCANASATVTVTETGSPNAGTDGSITLCSNDAPATLFNLLGGGPDAGGTWTAPGGGSHSGSFDPTTDAAGVYTYTIPAVAPCLGDQSTVTVSVNAAPNAGTNGNLTVCDQGAASSLFAALNGTPNAGGAWSGPSAVVGGLYDPLTMTPGVYTYTVNGTAPCANASATVTVTETGSPNAGTDGSITLCSNDAPATLFNLLGGGPDAGGSWTAPGGGAHSGSFDPSTDAAGVYTYTIAAVAPCLGDQSTVTVSVNAAPNAGTNGNLTVCDQGAATSLFNALNGTPNAGGAWSGPSAVVGGLYDPLTMTPGIYTYTVNGTAPCANASATVTVTETGSPNAGTDVSITLCSNDAPATLFNLLGGSPDAGGAWTAPGGGAHSGSFDAITDAAGVYTYTIAAVAPCLGDQSTVTVSVNAAPNAGANGNLTVCDQGAASSLFTALNGTPNAGGAWSGPSAVVGGQYDPLTMTPGVYTYTVNGTAPCANASATVTVTETTSPDAGLDGNLTLCGNGPVTNLFTLLGGTPDAGGLWISPSGMPHSGIFNPTSDPAGLYMYLLAALAPCTGDQSMVMVNILTPPNAGTDAGTTVCEQGGPVDLFTLLNGAPQPGGTWSGPSAITGGLYDPQAMNPGVYTYTVNGTAPCANATASVTVTETSAPDAGSDGSITVCSDQTAFSLFGLLGGTPDAGGIWTAPGGATMTGVFNPQSGVPGVYTYTLAAIGPCPGDQSTVTVNVTIAPNAGGNGSLTVCDQGGAVNLIDGLTGVPFAGGTWSGPAPVIAGVFDPLTMPAGTYTYTVAGTAPCLAASADVLITITSTPDAGVDGAVTLCSSDAPVALFAMLGGSPDGGGTWTTPGGGAHSGSFDASTDAAGVYTYTIAAVAPCLSDQSIVTVSVSTAPNAGGNGNLTVCEQGAAASLFSALSGTPDPGGVWSGPGTVVGGQYDPLTMTPGVYTYTVNGTAPCVNASASVTVTETTSPDAGMDGNLTLCSSASPAMLFALLGGAPDAGGTWTTPSGGAHSGSFDPATDAPGVYTYLVSATAPCLDDASTVTVTVEAAVNAGNDATLTLCTGDAPVALFTLLGGAPTPGGTWTDPLGQPYTGTFDPAVAISGAYTYTVPGTVCPADQSVVLASVQPGPNAGQPNSITVCSSDAPFNLFALLLGSPDPGGAWTTSSGVPVSATFNPAVQSGGAFTYTVSGNVTCPDATAVITVSVSQAVSAGTSTAYMACSSDAPIDLFPLLNGGTTPGGTWSDPNGTVFPGVMDPAIMPSGNYTYTVTGAAPCPASSAIIAVTVNLAVDAGQSASLSFCTSDAPVDLFTLLGGNPMPGGTWSGPGGSTSALLDPAMALPGAYTYTITGTVPCTDATATLSISIAQPAWAGSDGAIALCSNDPPAALFPLLSGSPDAGGSWTGPGGAACTGTLDPAVDASGAYAYVVNGTGACVADTALVLATITTVPTPLINASSWAGCVPLEVEFSQGWTGAGSCTWDFGNGQTSTDCIPGPVVYPFPGNYTVTLTIDVGSGCTATVTLPGAVLVSVPPVADFTVLPEMVNTADPLVLFLNQSTGASSYLWDFGDGATSTATQPTHMYDSPLAATYEVCLLAYSAPACADTICRTIEVMDGPLVWVPNSFTPDGDGTNDTFAPAVLGIARDGYRFDVFDRWGQPLFGTNDPDARWDGRSAGGQPVQVGVYIWKLSARDAIKGTRIERTGHVTLVR
ncbi:MAG: gliding motility-associated C-terminal domain-containing protein [Flavobacteriales bacterium]|nr:gliding motility-associated C-terminal domain-containing protein [Flavobacteriales bacterium]